MPPDAPASSTVVKLVHRVHAPLTAVALALGLVCCMSCPLAVRAATVRWDAASGKYPTEVPCPSWHEINDLGSPPALSGGLLTIATSPPVTLHLYYEQSGAELMIPGTLILQFGVRYVTGASDLSARAPITVGIETQPYQGTLVCIGQDEVFYTSANVTRGGTAIVNTDDMVHIYSVEITGTALQIFQDSNLILSGSTFFDNTTPAFLGSPDIFWGEGSAAAYGTSEWTFFQHNAGVNATAGSCIQPPPNLVSWWPGDADAVDIAGGNTATLQGGVLFACAKVDRGFFFDSNDDRVVIPHSPDLNIQSSGFTADFWMKGVKNQPGTLATFFEKSHGFTDNTGWALSVFSATGLPAFAIGDGVGFPNIIGSVDVLDGNLHHLAGTWDGGTMRLYVDGVPQGTAANGMPANNTRDVNIGFTWGGGTPQRFFRGVADELEVFARALSPAEIQAIVAAGSAGKCKTGSVLGHVAADCPAAGSALVGVRVDAFEVGTGDLAGTGVTDASGNYLIEDLAAGQYTTTIVTPLGYTATPELAVTVSGGETVTANFSLHCIVVTTNPRGIGFWKHQVGVATGGKGNAQIDAGTLCSYLDLIDAHFNSNVINQVIVYQPPASGTCGDKLQVAKALLNLAGGVAMVDRARQQLTAMLLNVAAGYISQTHVISPDGATVSQAITYCDNLIDLPAGDYVKAKTIAEEINSGIEVPAGTIPLSTAQIAYRRGLALRTFRVTPNPGPGTRTFQFAMGQAGPVRLSVYDVSGRLVKELANGQVEAGSHSVSWKGVTRGGARVGSGLYFARLETSDGSKTLKVIQLVR